MLSRSSTGSRMMSEDSESISIIVSGVIFDVSRPVSAVERAAFIVLARPSIVPMLLPLEGVVRVGLGEWLRNRINFYSGLHRRKLSCRLPGRFCSRVTCPIT